MYSKRKNFDPNNVKKLIGKKILNQNKNLELLFQGNSEIIALYSTKTLRLHQIKKCFI